MTGDQFLRTVRKAKRDLGLSCPAREKEVQVCDDPAAEDGCIMRCVIQKSDRRILNGTISPSLVETRRGYLKHIGVTVYDDDGDTRVNSLYQQNMKPEYEVVWVKVTEIV